MSKRRKPATDEEILRACLAEGGDLLAAAKLLDRKLATIMRRLKAQPLRSIYRGAMLAQYGGNVTITAKRLGLDRTHLHDLIAVDDILADGWATGRETRLDFAESKLDQNVEAGKEASIFFLLKCLGKARGYIERQEITGKDGAPIGDVKVTVQYVKSSDSG